MRRGSRRARTTIVLVFVPALLAALPASASAAIIFGDRPDDELEGAILVAKRGEANDVSVSVSANGKALVVVDHGAPLEARKRCRGGGAAGEPVRCRLDSERPTLSIYAALRDAADSFDSASLPGRHRVRGRTTGTFVYVSGGEGEDAIATGPSNSDIEPGPGDDVIAAGAGRDRVFTEPVADGADRLDGGRGRDEIDYFGRTRDLTLDLGSQEATDGEPGEGDAVFGFEIVHGGSGTDLLIGSDRANRIIGGDGGDRIYGGGGKDRLIGDGSFRGNGDHLNGGPGDDVLIGEIGRDALLGGPGRDRIDAASLSYIGLHGRDRARDRVNCGSGKDRVRAEPRDRLDRCERARRTRR